MLGIQSRPLGPEQPVQERQHQLRLPLEPQKISKTTTSCFLTEGHASIVLLIAMADSIAGSLADKKDLKACQGEKNAHAASVSFRMVAHEKLQLRA